MAGGSSPRESPGNFNSIELNESTLTSIVRRVYDSMQSTSEPRGDPGNLCTSVEGEIDESILSSTPASSWSRAKQPFLF